jgi:hypothetical protein
MAYTQTQLDALKAAYAEGVLVVTYDGRSVTYRSRAEMRAIISDIQAEVNATLGTPKKRLRQVRVTTGKGT